MGRARPVELGAGLAAELDDVGEAGGRDQRGAGAAALEQGVRCDGHPVGEAADVGSLGAGPVEHGVDGRHHAVGLVGRRRRRLGCEQLAVAGEDHRVGEGAADVDPEEHRRTLTAATRARGGRSRACGPGSAPACSSG